MAETNNSSEPQLFVIRNKRTDSYLYSDPSKKEGRLNGKLIFVDKSKAFTYPSKKRAEQAASVSKQFEVCPL